MTWNSPIKAIDIDSLDFFEIADFIDEYGNLFEQTVLMKKKGKVVGVCHLESLKRSLVMMCMYRDVLWGLRLDKIRRRNVFEKYCGKGIKEGDIIKEFSFTDCI